MFEFLSQIVSVGAHAVGLVTLTNAAINDDALTEVYLTQPAITANATLGAFNFIGILNFEGVTLRRGELNVGIWGEGYVDRRHPHTYLHEAVLTFEKRLGSSAFTISAGKGFAPFGSDDPMARPFVKYPANHHLSQVLERLVVIGAARIGPAALELGLFNGDEPFRPEDNGSLDKVGDSWSARGTVWPRDWIELSGSFTEITSPENPFGGGLDHRAWHVAARGERPWRGTNFYGLVEVGRAGELSDDVEIFHLDNFLAEASAARGPYQLALRLERSDRPEEERLTEGFPFRTVRPAPDNNVLGTTEWTTITAQLSRKVVVGSFMFAPIAEVAMAKARPNELPAIIDPSGLYGSDRLWVFSLGVRSIIGSWHNRMGRYGAAHAQSTQHKH